MDIRTITRQKENGGPWTKEEIDFAVTGYMRGDITDEEMTPWLRAILDYGMDFEETLSLTGAMVKSGEVVDLSAVEGFKVDKHSTGGVGDKTTLVVAPLAAACGLKMAKMSGPALGYTGGTIDKLKSIPGIKVDMTRQEFIDQVNTIGVAVMAASDEVVPADKKIYTLRDRTKTIASLPLIASSVMSKKIASGSDYIVLDIKIGAGAFLKSTVEAARLAELCVTIGEAAGKKTSAFLTDMDKPLGRAVGNTLEVKEAIETLAGRGPADVRELALVEVGAMLASGGFVGNLTGGIACAREVVETGAALEKMRELISAQGGDRRVVDDFARLRSPAFVSSLVAKDTGYIVTMDTEHIGWLAKKIGGFVFDKKTGDAVKQGDTMALALADSQATADIASQSLGVLMEIGPAEPPAKPLILDTVNVPE
ncbi:MAG: thymidine phosphorylase [Actinomycetota bacterium]